MEIIDDGYELGVRPDRGTEVGKDDDVWTLPLHGQCEIERRPNYGIIQPLNEGLEFDSR
jgi:hypothetical protein